MILIEAPDGSEQKLVKSLDGYEDWAVLDEDSREPTEDEVLDPKTKKWKVDLEKKAKRERKKVAQDLEGLLDRIENLEAEVAKLKKGKAQ